jgi:putative two-component system response regulator
MSSPVNLDNKGSLILVVDDLPFNVEVMEGILHREGYKIMTALHAHDVLCIAGNTSTDLAILDVMMPGMDGFDLCGKLKALSGLRFFPVILVTALNELEDKTKGLEAGADDFLTKPFHTAELVTKMQSLLRLRKLQSELDHSEDIIMILAIAIEAKDPYTKGHSERVGTLSTEFAAYIGLSEDGQQVLFRAGILHDIGKVGIDDYILHKRGYLTENEFGLVKEHVLVGENICQPLHSARSILPIIRHHHERWDGTGFPDGLKGEEIPFFARITAITDTFDAMVSVRPYRAPFSFDEAISRMEEERFSGQWDPDLLKTFFVMIRERRVKTR